MSSWESLGQSDEWYTPKYIFVALGCTFDLDVASPNRATHVPAKAFIMDESLDRDWHGFVWMNPPYSNPTPFVDKFIAHGNGICLVPMAKAKWFHRLWAESDVIVPMPVNLKFHRSNDKDAQIMFNTVLVGIGSKAIAAIIRAEFGRIR